MPENSKRQIDSCEIDEIDNGYVRGNNDVKNDIFNGKIEQDNISQLSHIEIDNRYVIDACVAGNISIINEYLTSGNNINNDLSSGWTLLLYATSYAQQNVVQYLLDLGADPNLHYEGYTPLMALSNSVKGSSQQRLECLKYLINAKVDFNAVSKLRETAFMFACKIQEIDFVSELFKYITDINYADSEQNTALFYAVADNRYEITKFLIEKGADITWVNFRGLTVYDIAVTKGYEELVCILNKDEKSEQEGILTECTSSWFNMFPTMTKVISTSIDNDVASILYGMGLDNYKSCFCGLNLKTVLNLEEKNLQKMGIDISVHRKRFVEDLLRFHKYEWSNNIIKIDQSQPFTLFEAIKLLGNLNRQIIVMSCSTNFAKNWFKSIKKTENLIFTNNDQQKYEKAVEEMQKIAWQIQNTVKQIKCTAVMMNQKSSHITMPIYIKKKSKFSYKWIILTFTIVGSMYLIKKKL